MSSVINHKIRSRRGYRKQQILAPKKSPMITIAKPRRKKRQISSLFLRKTAES